MAKERVKRSPILTNPLYRVIEEIGYRYISPEELKDRRARQSVHYLEAKPLQTPQFPEENFHVLNLFRDPRYGTLIQGGSLSNAFLRAYLTLDSREPPKIQCRLVS